MQAVTCGVEGRMPKGILEEEEAKQVAAFVAAYAGQIGKGPVVDTDDASSRPTQPATCRLTPRSVTRVSRRPEAVDCARTYLLASRSDFLV